MALIRDSKCQRVEKRILIYSTYFIVWRFHFGLRNSCCLPVREPSCRGEEEKREKREKPRLDRDEDGPPRGIVLVSSLASKPNRPPFFNNNANHVPYIDHAYMKRGFNLIWGGERTTHASQGQ